MKKILELKGIDKYEGLIVYRDDKHYLIEVNTIDGWEEFEDIDYDDEFSEAENNAYVTKQALYYGNNTIVASNSKYIEVHSKY